MILQFRELVKDEMPDEYDDWYLVRWLIGKNSFDRSMQTTTNTSVNRKEGSKTRTRACCEERLKDNESKIARLFCIKFGSLKSSVSKKNWQLICNQYGQISNIRHCLIFSARNFNLKKAEDMFRTVSNIISYTVHFLRILGDIHQLMNGIHRGYSPR